MDYSRKFFEKIQKRYYKWNELKSEYLTKMLYQKKSNIKKISFEKFQALLTEELIHITFFKSYDNEKFVLLEGIEFLEALLNFNEDELEKLCVTLPIIIIFSYEERNQPKEAYKKIKKMFDIDIEKILKDDKNE